MRKKVWKWFMMSDHRQGTEHTLLSVVKKTDVAAISVTLHICPAKALYAKNLNLTLIPDIL